MNRIPGHGPKQADIVIVGDCPNEEDELFGQAFCSKSSAAFLLRTMLTEAGIDPRSVYFTNVCKYRPPGNKIEAWLTSNRKAGTHNEWQSKGEKKDERWYSDEISEGIDELRNEILGRSPRVVVGLGDLALWSLSDNWGISDWRGSELRVDLGGTEVPFVPTLHPAKIFSQYSTRPFAAHDLQSRVARRLRTGFVTPEWDFNYEPTLADALAFITGMAGDVAVDVETSRGQIVCVGLGVSPTKAMCIPFISEGYGAYWSALDNQIIINALREAFFSGRVRVIGQNFNYDNSYFDANFDYHLPLAFDTLIAQSVLFPGTPRGLGYLASMYCDWHSYWKDDARDWQNLRDFDRLFRYNCRDVCATWEIAQKQRRALHSASLDAQYDERLIYNNHVFNMMQRGVIRDAEATSRLETEIEESLQEQKLIIADAAGYPINPTSPLQVSKLLYTEWKCKKPARKGKLAGGTGDEELTQVAVWHPERKDAISAILTHRSLASVRSTFVRAKLDPDGKLRSSFMATGTETFRLTSSKNNFGRGTNLLNVSGSGTTHSGNKVPNFRCAIVPPSGYTVFDCDLERADLQIVVWEADDTDLKAKMREGLDIHYENAKDIFGTSEPTPVQREKAKKFVHLTNYVGSARTCAIGVGLTVHEADQAQKRWFAAHPGIKKWHVRTQHSLSTSRTVRNPFGYRMTFFDRLEGLLPKAVAWIPQSAIAIVASKVHMAIDGFAEESGIDMQVWLQMYDSVAGCYPTRYEDEVLPMLREATRVIVPYDDPLIIPMGLNRSDISWGDCKSDKRGWPK